MHGVGAHMRDVEPCMRGVEAQSGTIFLVRQCPNYVCSTCQRANTSSVPTFCAHALHGVAQMQGAVAHQSSSMQVDDVMCRH